MKKILCLVSLFSFMLFTSCDTSSAAWENVKTAGRYLQKGVDSLWGKEYNSCVVENEDEFIGPDDADFIPLSDKDLRTQFIASDRAIPQPKYSPGESGSGIPGIGNFLAPSSGLSSVFKTLYFQTDDHVIRDQQDLLALQSIANYMKKHPKTYLCIEGHCDERASAAYNMALGTRRANHVRVLLIKHGIDFNRIYTISHGKEKPVALGHSTSDWKENRRAQFKLYEKR